MVPPQMSRNALGEFSKKLCEESRALRDSARITVAQSKEALASSRRLWARTQAQQRTRRRKTPIVCD